MSGGFITQCFNVSSRDETLELAKKIAAVVKAISEQEIRTGKNLTVGLIGPSSSGKTTLTKSIIDELSPENPCYFERLQPIVAFQGRWILPREEREYRSIDMAVRQSALSHLCRPRDFLGIDFLEHYNLLQGYAESGLLHDGSPLKADAKIMLNISHEDQNAQKYRLISLSVPVYACSYS